MAMLSPVAGLRPWRAADSGWRTSRSPRWGPSRRAPAPRRWWRIPRGRRCLRRPGDGSPRRPHSTSVRSYSWLSPCRDIVHPRRMRLRIKVPCRRTPRNGVRHAPPAHGPRVVPAAGIDRAVRLCSPTRIDAARGPCGDRLLKRQPWRRPAVDNQVAAANLLAAAHQPVTRNFTESHATNTVPGATNSCPK